MLINEVRREVALTSIQESPHGVTSAQGAQCGQVDNLGHRVRVGQVEDLRVQEVVAVEHQLGKQPVSLTIERRVSQIAADVVLDGDLQKIISLRVQVEVGVTRCAEAAWLEPVVGLVGVTCKEQSAGLMQTVEGCSRDVRDGNVVQWKG